MYNNQKRVELVKRRIYERNCQQQRHGIYGLSAACMVLFAFLAGTLHVVAGHTQMAAQGMYGSVLLYKDAGSYVLVSVVSFVLAVAVTLCCIRLRERMNYRKRRTKEMEGKITGTGKRIMTMMLSVIMVTGIFAGMKLEVRAAKNYSIDLSDPGSFMFAL